jgi:hypothetical protein
VSGLPQACARVAPENEGAAESEQNSNGWDR